VALLATKLGDAALRKASLQDLQRMHMRFLRKAAPGLWRACKGRCINADRWFIHT